MQTCQTAAKPTRPQPATPWAKLRPWLPILLATTLISAYSAKPGSLASPLDLTWRDKLDHFCVYAILAILLLQALPKRLQGTPRWLLAFLAISSFGLADELIQHYNPHRTGDPLDWLADSLGALLAVVAYTASPLARSIANCQPISLLHKTNPNLDRKKGL